MIVVNSMKATQRMKNSKTEITHNVLAVEWNRERERSRSCEVNKIAVVKSKFQILTNR